MNQTEIFNVLESLHVDNTGSAGTQNGNRIYDYIVNQWKQPITEQTLKAAVEKLREAGQLTFKSAARIKFDQACSGWTPDQIDFVVKWMKVNGLDTDGDNAFVNAAGFMNAMSGRTLTTDNLAWCLTYLQGKGVGLEWKPTPSQNQPNRGHKATSPDDYRWMPKEEVNRAHAGKNSHSSNPNFNGQKQREERIAEERRLGNASDAAIQQDHAMTEAYWQRETARAVATGTTHSERARIQQAANQTPGGAANQFKAAKAEANRLRLERERVR